FFHLLVGLFANPSCLDDGSQSAQVRLGGGGGEIGFFFSCRAGFADEPGLVPPQMLLNLFPGPLRGSVGPTHTGTNHTNSERSFRASTPSDVLPLGIGQHVFGWYRQNVRNRALTRTAALGNWPNQVHADRVHLEMARDANGPGQTARREPLPEWRAQSVPGISERTAKMDTGCNNPVDLSDANLRLRSRSLMFGRNPSPLQTCPIARPAFGKEEAQSDRHGHLAARQRQ